jgi:hypothetical protein
VEAGTPGIGHANPKASATALDSMATAVKMNSVGNDICR